MKLIGLALGLTSGIEFYSTLTSMNKTPKTPHLELKKTICLNQEGEPSLSAARVRRS